MRAEELVPEALRSLESVIAKACEFFQENPNFKELNSSQVYRLREIVADCGDWEKLEKEVGEFIKKQVERESRGALTGWKDVGAKLQDQLKRLLAEHQNATQSRLKRIAGRLKEAGKKTASREIGHYFNQPEYQKNLHFWLAQDFLKALYKLYRGKEVRKASSSGHPCCRSLEVGP